MKKTLIIVSAPSGAGKTTLCGMATQDFKDLEDCITYTTRSPRTGERDGDPYHFIETEKFKSLINEGFFAEWAIVHDRYYGISHRSLDDIWARQKAVIMDVDIQGAATLRAKFPWAVTIFIKPPSIDALRQRIESRDKGKTNNLDLRLQNAIRELNEAPKFNHVIVNDDIKQAYADFKKIIEEILKSR